MTISYLKKAKKTPQSGNDETRKIVADMLAKIEVNQYKYWYYLHVIVTEIRESRERNE